MAKNEELKKLDVSETKSVSGGIGVYGFRAADGTRRYFIPGVKKACRHYREFLKRRGIPMTSVYVHAMESEAEARAAAERELLQMRIAAKRPRIG